MQVIWHYDKFMQQIFLLDASREVSAVTTVHLARIETTVYIAR